MICNHRVFPAHNSGKADCLCGIADHKHGIIQYALLPVQCYKGLLILRTAHNDPAAFDRIQVIGMHRLSEFFHYIICNIYHIIDRADSLCGQTALHPFRRWCNPDIFDYTCRIARTQIRIFYFYLNIIIYVFLIACRLYIRRAERPAKCSCRLSCDTDHAEPTTASSGKI